MIKLKNFNFKYTGSTILNLENINLDIKKGECVLFTGHTGCGKTTLLRLLNGLAPTFFDGGYNGELKIAHLKIGDDITEFSKCVGSVFQNPKNQFFHLDSTSELAFSMENYGYDKEIILERIDFISKKFFATHLLDKNILSLSGGEKQKLSFMASMMLDADIYILDEVTSNLDLKSINLIKDIISSLKDNGKTIIIAEHRIYYLKDLIDKMYILCDGKIIKEFSKDGLNYLDGNEYKIREIFLDNVLVVNKKIRKIKQNVLRLENFSYKLLDKYVEIGNKFFDSGKVYGVVGDNGCGKTTFANSLVGFNKYKGNVILLDNVLKKRDLVKNTFVVMQDVNYQLFTNTVKNEILLGINDYTNFDYVVDKLKLRNLLDRHPNTLSGGEKQRVVLASALLSNKKILIFDEPTSGLDYINMKELSELILEISDKDKVIFVITHDFEFLCNVADEVLFFSNKGIHKTLELKEETKNTVLELMS